MCEHNMIHIGIIIGIIDMEIIMIICGHGWIIIFTIRIIGIFATIGWTIIIIIIMEIKNQQS